jgi:thiamine-monophosphate kinase
LAGETGVTLAGGDLTSSPVLFLSLTVVGHAAGQQALVSRAGARPGDALVVSGELGGAAAGLLLLQGSAAQSSARERALVARQLHPHPRLDAGRALAAAGARAMIDLSDGLGGDARHLAAAGGVGLRIDAAALPLAAGLEEVAATHRVDALELAVSGGEDYELLAALPPDAAAVLDAIAARAGTALTPIGEVVAEGGVEIRLPGGRLMEPIGFEALR